MSSAELKAEVDRLTPEERRQLTAYIVEKNRPTDAEVKRELARKIDDHDPAHWLTLEDLGKRLGIGDESAAS